MKKTANYNLNKPEGSDVVNIEDLNINMDIIDTELKDLKNKTSGITAENIKLSSGKTIEVKFTEVDTSITEAKNRAEQAFQSASDGKQRIASAITGKGVPASGSDTFLALASKIDAIETDKTGDATAVAGDIIKGKTAYSKGNKLTGTLELTGDALLEHVLAGNTFYNNDAKVKRTGTMPNRAGNVTGQSISGSGNTLRIRPQRGYYNGGTTNSVEFSDPNWIESNILEGKEIFGKVGSLRPGKKFATGTITNGDVITFYNRLNNPIDYPAIEITGLGFTPSVVIVRENSSYSGTVTIYNKNAPATYGRIIVGERISGSVSISTHVIIESNPAIVSSELIRLPVYTTNNNQYSFHWIAYE